MKHTLKYIIAALLFFTFCIEQTAAQDLLKSEYSFRRYTTQDGLPSVSVSKLFQDSRGFLWISSNAGLARFNGFEFNTFLKGQFANIFFVNENKNGEIQAFTNNIRHSINQKTNQMRTDTLAQNIYITLNSMRLPNGYGVFYESRNIGGKQHFFKITDKGKIEKIIENDDLNNFDYDTDLNFYYDEQNEHLYIPYPAGVKVVNRKGKITEYKGIAAYGFFVYKNEICCLAADGVYLLKNGKANLLIRQKLETRATAATFYDGSLIFGDAQNIYQWKNNAVKKIFTSSGIYDFIVDGESNLWVATSHGLYNLFRLQFKNFVCDKKENIITSVLYYPENKAVIAGTENGLLFEIKENSTNQLYYPQKNGVKFGFHCGFNGAVADKKAFLPATCDVLQINKNASKWLNINPNPASDDYAPYYHASTLSDGNLAVGTQTNIQIITPEGKVLKHYDGIPFFRQALFSNAVADQKGRIWYGGYYGVALLGKDSVVETYFGENYKLCQIVQNDKEKNVWFASENRLFKYANDSVKLVKTFENIIQNIYFTSKKYAIIATLDGIFIYDENFETFSFYNHENGFMGFEAISGSMTEDEQGNVYLPAINGLASFNPEILLKKQSVPKLYFIGVFSSTDNVKWQLENSDFPKFNHRYNDIRFSYIGLSYSAAENVRYHYRLLGFQNEWSEPTKQREVTFNNLPHGDYTFEIYSDAGTDDSKSEIQRFSFSIKPAFWQTAWFWVAFMALLVAASVLVALYFSNRKNRRLLAKLETEKQLNELKINAIRLKAIPHFNANVLAAIEYYIMNKSKEEAINVLGIYSQFTFQTLQEVDKASRSLSAEIDYVKMYLDLEKLRFGEKFEYEILIDKNVNKDVQLPNMILHTWAENAVKHGLAGKTQGGVITISAEQNGDFLTVSVQDNGVGRQAAAINRNVRSTKQGLSILERQVEIYNRFNAQKIKLSVEDLERGTRFSIEIPESFNYNVKWHTDNTD
ncbi:MAG: histidine kinase [Prevotellaceae bacterium]|jgi:ligand-binding sensor domain-containing protein|nr:histidine kinase [Prevotellaceae bacterium]